MTRMPRSFYVSRSNAQKNADQDKALAGSTNLPAASYANFVRAPVASRAEGFGYANVSDGTATGSNLRRQHVSAVALESFRVKYPGWGENGSVEVDQPQDLTVRAAIEYPVGTYHPLFFGGKRDVTVQPGATVESDPVAVPIPAGAQFWTRTFVTVATAATLWRCDYSVNAALGEACSATAGEADLTTSGTIAGTAKGYAPCAIISDYVPATQPVLFVVGDSIAKGALSSSQQGGSGHDLLGGFVERALAGQIPYERCAIYGTKAQQFAVATQSRRQWSLANGTNCMLCMLGNNDCTGGRTLAQIQVDLLSIWTRGKARGMRVWQSTVTPVATSTDSFATTGNQTTHASNAVRVGLNTWVRAGAPINSTTKAAVAVGTSGALLAGQSGHPLYNYLEIADLVESARDSGLWKTGQTTDGTHPNASGHATVAAGLTPKTTFVLT